MSHTISSLLKINYPFGHSISTEDRIFWHHSTGSTKHGIMQTKRLAKTGLEVDQKDYRLWRLEAESWGRPSSGVSLQLAQCQRQEWTAGSPSTVCPVCQGCSQRCAERTTARCRSVIRTTIMESLSVNLLFSFHGRREHFSWRDCEQHLLYLPALLLQAHLWHSLALIFRHNVSNETIPEADVI